MSEQQTVIQVLETTAAAHGALPALRFKRAGNWESVSWTGYVEQVRAVARGLVAIGVEPKSATVILADNSPGWFFAHFGSIAAGATPTGIYTNCTPDQCRFIAEHCEAAVAFVGNAGYLRRILAIRHRLPHLRAVVLLEDDHEDDAVHSMSALVAAGRTVSETALEERIEALDPDEVCQLIYTSGTTGEPKAVMLTHRNIVWVAGKVMPVWGIQPGEAMISYLPLSHIAEQVITLYSPIFSGACTWFVERLEKLGENLREVRPHIFFAVPRVWEKIQAAIEGAGAARPRLQRSIARWARRQGLVAGYAEQQGQPRPWTYGLADRLVFGRVRRRLGLDRCRGVFTAAAPISRHTLEFFLGLGIPILEVYGMSETTGPATLSTRDAYRTGKAGRALPGTEIKIAADGEIWMRGPHVSPGYFNNPAADIETFDEEGWLHSGDIGEIDNEGFLTITDRKKELIITSGGKNIAPQAIEKELRRIALVEQAVVVGDRRNYLTALLTLDRNALGREAAKLGSTVQDPESAATCPILHRHLAERIAEVNRGLARFETVKRFAVLPVEFSIDGGELTPTMKLKRRLIHDKYADDIDRLYTADP